MWLTWGAKGISDYVLIPMLAALGVLLLYAAAVWVIGVVLWGLDTVFGTHFDTRISSWAMRNGWWA